MPTEHSGGIPSLSFEAGSGPKGDYSIPVTTTDFDYSKLDSDEELLQECADLHLDMRPRLRTIVERESRKAAAEAVNGVIILILDSQKPVMQAHVIMWACGGYVSEGVSMPVLARRLGVKKQAFQQAVKRTSEKLCLRQTRAMRSELAREHMHSSYEVHHKVKIKAKALFVFNLPSVALGMVRWLRRKIQAAPISTWTKQRRRTMRLELQPIVDIHSQL